MLTTSNYEGVTEVYDNAGGIERLIPFHFNLMLAPDADEGLMEKAAMAISMFLTDFYREEGTNDPDTFGI